MERNPPLKRTSLDCSNGAQIRFVTLEESHFIEEKDIEELGKEIHRYFESEFYGPDVPICIDLKKIDFLNSGVLGKLIIANRMQKEHYKKPLGIVNIHPHVHEIFQGTSLGTTFNIKSTRQEYLDSL